MRIMGVFCTRKELIETESRKRRKKNLTLSPKAIDLLREGAERLGMTDSAYIEYLIRQEAERKEKEK